MIKIFFYSVGRDRRLVKEICNPYVVHLDCTNLTMVEEGQYDRVVEQTLRSIVLLFLNRVFFYFTFR